MTSFREVQPLRRNPLIWLCVLATALLVALPLSMPVVRENMTTELALLLAAAALPLFWLFAVRLETEVRDEGLWIRFRAAWFPVTYAWNDIQRVETVDYRPLVETRRWMARGGRREFGWIVWGRGAVRVYRRNGKSFLLGTAQPEKLAAAIAERISPNRTL